MKPGIGKPLFVSLLQQFCDDSGYQISYKGKPLEFQIDYAAFFRKLFLFMVSVVVSSGRVAISHIVEAEYAPSKRKEGQTILRIRPHGSIVRHVRDHVGPVEGERDLSFDTLLDKSYTTYNSLVELQDTRRDTIILVKPKYTDYRDKE